MPPFYGCSLQGQHSGTVAYVHLLSKNFKIKVILTIAIERVFELAMTMSGMKLFIHHTVCYMHHPFVLTTIQCPFILSSVDLCWFKGCYLISVANLEILSLDLMTFQTLLVTLFKGKKGTSDKSRYFLGASVRMFWVQIYDAFVDF